MVSKRYFDAFNEETLSIKLGFTYYDEIMSGRHVLNGTTGLLDTRSLSVLTRVPSSTTSFAKAEVPSKGDIKELGRARIMGRQHRSGRNGDDSSRLLLRSGSLQCTQRCVQSRRQICFRQFYFRSQSRGRHHACSDKHVRRQTPRLQNSTRLHVKVNKGSLWHELSRTCLIYCLCTAREYCRATGT